MLRRVRRVTVLVLALVPATAQGASLYSGPGSRPGPDILYARAVAAPQLQNAPGSPWKAAPILVSGSSAYRGGEFLYQDFLYDDHGADTGFADSGAESQTAASAFALPNGEYTYPSAAGYAGNAADFVELRATPLAGATALRVTLQTLKDPSLVAFSIAIGTPSSAVRAFPAGANVRAPADLFLTVRPGASGPVAELVKADGSPAGGGAPSVTLDNARRQFDVRVPHTAWAPGRSVARLSAGIGLWDKAAGRYLLPGSSAGATKPGGAGLAVSPAAFFNVAFRFAEAMPEFGNNASTALVDPRWWRDKAQGDALASGDISAFHADVDFGKLATKANDESGVPKTGSLNRIFASRFEPFQGVSFAKQCLGTNVIGSGGADCLGEYGNQLQPYSVYVPKKPRPAGGYGLTLLLHSLGAGYNQFTNSRNQSQFGERGTGSIVITDEARGPDGGYDGLPGADAFEMWADAARNYRLDPAWTVIAGYSMGGLGTFKLGEQFPDLFARAQPTVGADQIKLPQNLRHIPVLMWNAPSDELVGPELYIPAAQSLADHGYRYELDQFSPAEHLTLAVNDQYAPAAEFLGTAKVDRDPAHVTFARDPTFDYAKYGFVSDHAYWVSRLALRGASTGEVDVLSHGFGTGDPKPSGVSLGGGTLTGGAFPAIGFASAKQTWGPVAKIPVADRLDITAKNVASVTIDHRRARVSCHPKIAVTGGPLNVTLAGCEKPRLTRFHLSRTRIRAGRTATTISYRDTAAGVATITVRKVIRGKERFAGSFRHRDRIGLNRIRFAGRLKGRRLAPGLYRLAIRSRSDGGLSGTIKRYLRITA